ncbi:hypothetical protein BJY04DRAFT_38170 [Aspergillus karnatakaensis]|uniref:uncharacterized protein n=1 Tax=Aspergillus karnatakaensis TaxID=1810916 RepID=UPI003CCD2488
MFVSSRSLLDYGVLGFLLFEWHRSFLYRFLIPMGCVGHVRILLLRFRGMVLPFGRPVHQRQQVLSAILSSLTIGFFFNPSVPWGSSLLHGPSRAEGGALARPGVGCHLETKAGNTAIPALLRDGHNFLSHTVATITILSNLDLRKAYHR